MCKAFEPFSRDILDPKQALAHLLLVSCKDSPMTVEKDAAQLLAHLDSIGVTGSERVSRGWGHMGAALVEAALQRQRNYKSVVLPAAQAVKEAWPDAETTSGLRKRMQDHDLGKVIKYRSPSRILQVGQMAAVLESHKVETIDDFREMLSDQQRGPVLRKDLDGVKYVGSKTLDYLEILVGISSVAVDSRLTRVTKAAGIERTDYDHLAAVIRAAAADRGWRPGDLDAALWPVGERQ